MRTMIFGFATTYLAFMGFFGRAEYAKSGTVSRIHHELFLLPLAIIGLCAIGYDKLRAR